MVKGKKQKKWKPFTGAYAAASATPASVAIKKIKKKYRRPPKAKETVVNVDAGTTDVPESASADLNKPSIGTVASPSTTPGSAATMKMNKKLRPANAKDGETKAAPEADSAAPNKEKGKKPEKSSGFIFMCNSKTKPECYRYRVFGLPKGQAAEVQKIKVGAKLFLYDFNLKLLYGIYTATSKGGLNLVPGAFGGRYPSQVQFKIHSDCLPLPESSFKHAIKENYISPSKFNPDLNAKQVGKLRALFKKINLLPPGAPMQLMDNGRRTISTRLPGPEDSYGSRHALYVPPPNEPQYVRNMLTMEPDHVLSTFVSRGVEPVRALGPTVITSDPYYRGVIPDTYRVDDYVRRAYYPENPSLDVRDPYSSVTETVPRDTVLSRPYRPMLLQREAELASQTGRISDLTYQHQPVSYSSISAGVHRSELSHAIYAPAAYEAVPNRLYSSTHDNLMLEHHFPERGMLTYDPRHASPLHQPDVIQRRYAPTAYEDAASGYATSMNRPLETSSGSYVPNGSSVYLGGAALYEDPNRIHLTAMRRQLTAGNTAQSVPVSTLYPYNAGADAPPYR